MKLVNLRKAKAELSAMVKASQRAPICLTAHGRPVAILTGARGRDFEDLLLSWDPEFWRELDERTRRARRDAVSLEDFRRELTPGPTTRRSVRRRKG